MFGLKSDWSLEVNERYFTMDDYCGADPRWCTGCGDLAILTAIHKVCREEQLLPEKLVAVSGIGCSSRLPHYMGTYGFHGLHGRALPVACGIKSRRPDLDIWVATGDGDCFSIGAAHWVHALRYNMDLVVIAFDNGIYGLTKKQSSPTTPQDYATNTHPHGPLLPPINPLTITLGVTNVSFVAQMVDWNPPLLYETLKAAHDHRGTSFVRIVQRCPQYMEDLDDDLQKDPGSLLLLRHDQGIQVPDNVERLFENQVEHDPSDLAGAFAMAARQDKMPVGLLYHNPNAERYDEFTRKGLNMTDGEKLRGLNEALDKFAV